MTTIESRVSTPWKTNSTEDAHKIIAKNEIFLLTGLREKSGMTSLVEYFKENFQSEFEIYGIFGHKKRIVTYIK